MMNSKSSIDSTSAHDIPPTHQDFHWIEGPLQGAPHANFIETTLDIAAGIHACLQIGYASALERAANRDADPGTAAPPALGILQADQLMRLSIASAALLRDEARRQVAWMDQRE